MRGYKNFDSDPHPGDCAVIKTSTAIRIPETCVT